MIAYKQPVTAAEIGEIRSVNTSGVLSTLLERHLIKIVGRKNVIGRPFLYGTTKEFLIRFGLNDLGDLPKIEDMAQQLGFEPPPILMETAGAGRDAAARRGRRSGSDRSRSQSAWQARLRPLYSSSASTRCACTNCSRGDHLKIVKRPSCDATSAIASR